MSSTQDIYEGFQRGELHRWDGLFAVEVEANSPAAWGVRGLYALKGWAGEFLKAFKPRIDLLDTHEALDGNGDGRGFLTINLNWRHIEPFYGIQPTGREGTSVETLILTYKGGKVVKVGVADNTLDLVLYLWDRGWPMPHNVRPDPLVRGIERS